MTLPSVVDLAVARDPPVALVGGKAANLARLAALGLPVPRAVAVTTAAFDQYLRFQGLTAAEGQEEAAARAFAAGRWPPALRAEVERALEGVPGATVAVRSSATCEDGARWSLAGQFQSFLSVPRAEALERVTHCWASLAKPGARAYLARLPPGTVRMGVVLQEQVAPAWSGVAFSLDPVTRDLDDLVVEWTEGTGERLLHGEVTPHRLQLRRHGGELPGDLPAPLRGHLLALREHLRAVERAFGVPVDVEWCATEAALFLLQARPVTAAAGAPELTWSSVNLAENFQQPLAPLEWSFLEAFYGQYARAALRLVGWGAPELAAAAPLLDSLTGIHRGRIHYNLAAWHGLLGCFPGGAALSTFFDGYIGQDAPAPAADEGLEPLRQRYRGVAGALRFWPRLALALGWAGFRLARLERRLALARPAWRRRLAEARDPREAERVAGEVLGLVEAGWSGPCGADLAVMVLPGLLGRLVERWCGVGPAEALPDLLAGVVVKSGEPSRLLWQLAQACSGGAPGLARLREQSYQAWWDELAPVHRAAFQAFLDRYGARCWSDCALGSPSFEERPDLAFRLVQQYAGQPEALSPEGRQRAVATRQARLRALCAPLPCHRAAALRLVTRLSHRAIQDREVGRLAQSVLFGEARRAFLRLGELLLPGGVLHAREDVFDLTWPELRDLGRGALAYPECLPALVEARRRSRSAAASAPPPECFVLRAGEVLAAASPATAPAPRAEATLRGVAVSRGRARGRARVLRDPARQALDPGEILVAPSVDPGWTPLIFMAGGLVLERGGVLSHGAVVAREAGIPGLVQVRDACREIADGALLEVDADAGTVQVEPADG